MRIQSVTVDTSSLDAVLRFEPDERLRTTPGIAARALEVLPGLAKHRCANDVGAVFPAEARDTEVAHLVEHVACELMALSGSPRTLAGSTSWDFAHDGRGVFHVTLAFDDDLVALGALKAAVEVVSALVAGDEPPDVAIVVERLRRVRAGE